jgi:hypothetical protein
VTCGVMAVAVVVEEAEASLPFLDAFARVEAADAEAVVS